MTSTRNRILLIVALFLLPILARALFYYQGLYWNTNVKTPEYTSYTVPEPPTPSSSLKLAAGVAAGKVVLIDANHKNQFQPDELQPLVTALSARGARVALDQSDKSLQSRLRSASTYITFAPTTSFSEQDLLAIQQFVASGGRLLVFTDPTRDRVEYDSYGNPTTYLDVNYANPILAPFGLSFVNDYLYNLAKNEGNFRNVEFTGFGKHALTNALKMVVFYGAHTVNTHGGQALVTGSVDTLSSLTDQGGNLSSMAISADGQVLAIGDFTFLTDPYNQVADNGLLLSNLADFALGGKRTPLLANFPFVFERPVTLVTTLGRSINPDLLSPIAALQQSLQGVNIPLTVDTRLPAGEHDAIILGTFGDIAVNLAASLQPFSLNTNAFDGTVDVPGFGKVGPGDGLLLYNRGPATNTLILLADKETDLPKLVQTVAGGDLSSCIVQNNIAVCSIGSAGSSAGSDYYYDTATPSSKSSQPTSTPLPP